MDPHLKALLDDAALGARRVKAIADAVKGSPITVEAERLVPGLAGLVTRVSARVDLVAALGRAEPAIGAAIEVYEALGGKPMDANDIAKLNADKGADFPV